MRNSIAKRAFFVIPPSVHLLDITGPAHIFHEAEAYGADLSLHFIALQQNGKVLSSAGLFLCDLQDFSAFSLTENDLLFLPGMDFDTLTDTRFLSDCAPFFQWLNEQMENGAQICSVCTGAFLLGFAGLLRKRKTTTHWKYFDRFQECFPDALLQKERLFVSDGNLHASGGVSSGIDLALHLMEAHYGAPFAAKIAKEVVLYLRRGENDPQLSVFLRYRNHLSDQVHQVQDLMATRLDEKLTIPDLAEAVHTSPRNLTRIFRKHTGLSIGEYHKQLRTERARQLLAEGHKLEATAKAVGLKSVNQLRHLLPP